MSERIVTKFIPGFSMLLEAAYELAIANYTVEIEQ